MTNLATTFNKESIDEIENTFWQKDLMTVVTVDKKPLKVVATSLLFIALCSDNTVLQQSLTLAIGTELYQYGKFNSCL